MASHMQTRLSGIQCGHPQKLRIHYHIAHVFPRDVERAAHNILAKYRLSGEWFNCPAAQAIEAIDNAAIAVDCGFAAEAFAIDNPVEESFAPSHPGLKKVAALLHDLRAGI